MSTLTKFKEMDGDDRETILRFSPLTSWPRWRKETADRIRRERNKFRDVVAKIREERPDYDPGPDFAKFVREHCREFLKNTPPKPTRANIWAAMKSHARAAGMASSRMGEWDTEYYSACGHDDYLAEVAWDHRVSAIACGRDWCRLTHR